MGPFAKISGPPARLVDVAGTTVLIVERFDLAGPIRIGYASALTMLAARDGQPGSYLDIAAVLEERSSRVDADLHELWRRIVFTILVSNTDDHLRNHGFLHGGGDTWTLSPAFDIKTAADLDIAWSVAPMFRLMTHQAATIVAEVSGACRRWRHVAARNGLSPREIAPLAPAFEHTAADRASAFIA